MAGEGRLRGEARFFLGQCFQRKGFTDLARKEYEKAAAEFRAIVDDLADQVVAADFLVCR